MEDGKKLRTWVDGQPQPQDVGVAAESRPQFVQLEIGKLEMTEKVLVEALGMQPSAGQPGDDGRLTVAENPLCGGWVQPFGQSRQYHGDLVRGGLQPVQWGVASGTERGVAGLTTKRLNPLSRAMLAIPDESMDVSVCDPKVRTLTVRTGEALRIYAFGSTPPAFHLAPGAKRQRR
jgi:hypothetical protein